MPLDPGGGCGYKEGGVRWRSGGRDRLAATQRGEGSGRFPATRWTLVARAGERSGAAWTAALGELLSQYAPVLRTHLVRHMGFAAHAAEDLVQAFAADRILEKNLLARAEAGRGRFRSFLLRAFTNYVVSQVRRSRAQKRGPAPSEMLSVEDVPDLPSAQAGLHQAFEAEWARGILARTLDRMRAECAAGRRPDVWGVFECRVLRPVLEQAPAASYEDLVERFGCQSPSQASNLLVTAKRMFRRALEEIVADTVRDRTDVEGEIRDLRKALAACRAGSAAEMRSTW
jgi:RNA polymerase sigma-70 factor (ECF subfamily)